MTINCSAGKDVTEFNGENVQKCIKSNAMRAFGVTVFCAYDCLCVSKSKSVIMHLFIFKLFEFHSPLACDPNANFPRCATLSSDAAPWTWKTTNIKTFKVQCHSIHKKWIKSQSRSKGNVKCHRLYVRSFSLALLRLQLLVYDII